MHHSHPALSALGDRALLIRFSDRMDGRANARAIAAACLLEAACLPGVVEIKPDLVSVLLRYDPFVTSFEALSGEIGLAMGQGIEPSAPGPTHPLAIRYGGEDGPDLDTVARTLGLTPEAFIAAHGAVPLRVLAVGFAPGFIYCGLHPAALRVPRRTSIRPRVPAGTVLFAAGQTAITATPIPTGWSVIGRTDLRNFDPQRRPPTVLRAGDLLTFRPLP